MNLEEPYVLSVSLSTLRTCKCKYGNVWPGKAFMFYILTPLAANLEQNVSFSIQIFSACKANVCYHFHETSIIQLVLLIWQKSVILLWVFSILPFKASTLDCQNSLSICNLYIIKRKCMIWGVFALYQYVWTWLLLERSECWLSS